MYPTLFDLGGFEIHTYGVLGAVGFLLVAFLVLRRARALGWDKDGVVDVIFWGALAGLAGSRVLWVLQNPEAVDGVVQWLDVRNGGLVFYGALLTGLPVGALVMWRRGLPFFQVMDVLATAMPVGHAISRVGCLFAGCCYGRPTDVPWAITFAASTTEVPAGVPLHPTQLYAAAYLFGIAAVVNWFYPRRRFDGQVMALYLGLYAVARSVNEVFRGDVNRGFVLEEQLGQVVSFSQGVSLLVALAAAALFVVGARLAEPVQTRGVP